MLLVAVIVNGTGGSLLFAQRTRRRSSLVSDCQLAQISNLDTTNPPAARHCAGGVQPLIKADHNVI